MSTATYPTSQQVTTTTSGNNSLEQIMTLLQELVSVVKNNNNNNNSNNYTRPRYSADENRPERNRRPPTCFVCQKVGHYARECPNRDRPVRNGTTNNQSHVNANNNRPNDETSQA
ncbi:hypothetical protein C2G38_2050521 [Gigaspora rosea]|uniref:CCHC-type domain-containing protein n=1 Tax=Gigaspora rosea TaxID=44941 RepID=A0A397TV14_9GLOM|nr:hypothetical protein C2G38_2050521 [Gigaspora rosea]